MRVDSSCCSSWDSRSSSRWVSWTYRWVGAWQQKGAENMPLPCATRVTSCCWCPAAHLLHLLVEIVDEQASTGCGRCGCTCLELGCAECRAQLCVSAEP